MDYSDSSSDELSMDYSRAEEDHKLGCTIILQFDNNCSLLEAQGWVFRRSGLSQKHNEKIMGSRIVTASSIAIEFLDDKDVNCFEAMQEITRGTIGFQDRYKKCSVKLLNMNCPFGRFLVVKRVYINDISLKQYKSVSNELRLYGDILNIKRCDLYGFRTGVIYVIMFIRKGSKLLNENWLDRNKMYHVEPFLAAKHHWKIDEGKVQELWSKYGFKKLKEDSLSD